MGLARAGRALLAPTAARERSPGSRMPTSLLSPPRSMEGPRLRKPADHQKPERSTATASARTVGSPLGPQPSPSTKNLRLIDPGHLPAGYTTPPSLPTHGRECVGGRGSAPFIWWASATVPLGPLPAATLEGTQGSAIMSAGTTWPPVATTVPLRRSHGNPRCCQRPNRRATRRRACSLQASRPWRRFAPPGATRRQDCLMQSSWRRVALPVV